MTISITDAGGVAVHSVGCTSLIGADLSNLSLTHMALSETDLSHVNFGYSNLLGAAIHKSNLAYANFRNTNLSLAVITNSILTGANFHGANFYHTDFTGSDFSGAIIADGWVCTGEWVHINNLGTDDSTLELYHCTTQLYHDGIWYARRVNTTGSIVSGSVDEFLSYVQWKHGDDEYAQGYRSVISAHCL